MLKSWTACPKCRQHVILGHEWSGAAYILMRYSDTFFFSTCLSSHTTVTSVRHGQHPPPSSPALSFLTLNTCIPEYLWPSTRPSTDFREDGHQHYPSATHCPDVCTWFLCYRIPWLVSLSMSNTHSLSSLLSFRAKYHWWCHIYAALACVQPHAHSRTSPPSIPQILKLNSPNPAESHSCAQGTVQPTQVTRRTFSVGIHLYTCPRFPLFII